MASIRICLFATLNFATLSLQAAKNPLTDFCRRWGHQTAQIDDKLYIDGGQVAWNPISTNPLNYTNTWLLYSDLNSTTQDIGMPQQYANLTKNSTVPSVSGGILWADEVNKAFYLFGGEFQDSPEDFTFWAYDVILNQWNETGYTSNVNEIGRVSFGAGTQMNQLGFGFYYGGYMNSQNTPGWKAAPKASSNLIKYDMTGGTLNNNTGPDDVGRAEGAMVYLPASDGGLLVYFGGLEQDGNGSMTAANMSTIHIFDVASSKWYTQTAGGTVPQSRRQFCAGATWADDHSSYNIYLYGGYGTQTVDGFDDVYILSLPSFTWIKAWPTENLTSPVPHGGCSANVFRRDQMLIIGGWFTNSDVCDSPNGWGQHNMNLGMNGQSKAIWDKYDPKLAIYFVPTPIIKVIGGGPTGGAKTTAPPTWDNPDLAVYFSRIPTFSARTATRPILTGTLAPKIGSNSNNDTGPIAGGVVGGLAALLAILGLVLFCLRRRKKVIKGQEGEKGSFAPPAELAATQSVHELASPGAAKWMSMQRAISSAHTTYSDPNSAHLISPSGTSMPPEYQQHNPALYSPQAYYAASSSSTATHPSSFRPDFNQPATYPPNYPKVIIPQNNGPSELDAQSINHQQSPISATSPTQKQLHFDPPQLVPHSPNSPQPYYSTMQPPLRHPAQSMDSHQTPMERVESPADTQYSSDWTDAPNSTSNTPTHFYAQPIMRVGAMHSPPGEQGETDERRPGHNGFRGSLEEMPQIEKLDQTDHL